MDNRLIRLCTVAAVLLLAGAAQTAAQIVPTPNNAAIREEIMRREAAEVINRRISAAKAVAREEANRPRNGRERINYDIDAIYRNPTDKELALISPSPEDRAKYRSFLGRKGTGLIRLVPDNGCGDTTRTVSAAGPCLTYSMPGNGSSYSFRRASYGIRRLADLHFYDGKFGATGVIQHAFITGIGDVPMDTPELKRLVPQPMAKFAPIPEVAAAIEVSNKINQGWSEGGSFFAREVKALEGMTYVLRSVAYRGTLPRSIGGVAYDELDFDRRGDITVAFRIVRKHDDGSVTILWKEIERKEAPEVKNLRQGTDRNNFQTGGQ